MPAALPFLFLLLLLAYLFLIALLASFDPFPTVPVAVLVVLDLRVLHTVGVALLAVVLRHDPSSHSRHAGDAGLGEQSLILLKLPVPLVLTNIGLGSSQVPEE